MALNFFYRVANRKSLSEVKNIFHKQLFACTRKAFLCVSARDLNLSRDLSKKKENKPRFFPENFSKSYQIFLLSAPLWVNHCLSASDSGASGWFLSLKYSFQPLVVLAGAKNLCVTLVRSRKIFKVKITTIIINFTVCVCDSDEDFISISIETIFQRKTEWKTWTILRRFQC